jgi:hypothetical protein
MKKDFSKYLLKKEKVLSNINNVLEQVSTKGINSKDFDLLERLLSIIAVCYGNKVNEYINYYRNVRINEINDLHYDWSEARNENQLADPRMSDCVKAIRFGLPEKLEANINFFPSDNKGICRPQCVVLSTGDWEFGDTKFRNDILSYWYRCFYANRFTIIFTESWQSGSWQKWKQLVDAYVAEQNYEINGVGQAVDHNVVIIEYSEDGIQLRYCERSIS